MNEIKKVYPGNMLCFSHLRWDFVYQRPQHLLSRFSGFFKVYFLEEPHFDAQGEASLTFIKQKDINVYVGAPHLPAGLSAQEVNSTLSTLLDEFFKSRSLKDFAFWYYTPMALSFSEKFIPAVTVFDCMDELSAFKFAPQELKDLERKLLAKADVVFTGGNSLYEAKKHQHANIHAFPSSIDKAHFAAARKTNTEPKDQAAIKGKKLGFYGVIDERFDIELIREIAEARPDLQLMLIGPVVKIDPATLPQRPNIHYLGGKSYSQLPAYLSGWDVALIPFAIDESTRFISPTKTPEYLAAGIPVVSTPIKDVINPYGIENLVHIGFTADEFIQAVEQALNQKHDEQWLERVDKFLKNISWEITYKHMLDHILAVLRNQNLVSIAS